MQAQGHVQLLAEIFEGRRNPQAAMDAPRWQAFAGVDLGVERDFPHALRDELGARGHEVREMPSALFGGAQAIWRLAGGGYLAASDPRKDGMAAGF